MCALEQVSCRPSRTFSIFTERIAVLVETVIRYIIILKNSQASPYFNIELQYLFSKDDDLFVYYPRS